MRSMDLLPHFVLSDKVVHACIEFKPVQHHVTAGSGN